MVPKGTFLLAPTTVCGTADGTRRSTVACRRFTSVMGPVASDFISSVACDGVQSVWPTFEHGSRIVASSTRSSRGCPGSHLLVWRSAVVCTPPPSASSAAHALYHHQTCPSWPEPAYLFTSTSAYEPCTCYRAMYLRLPAQQLHMHNCTCIPAHAYLHMHTCACMPAPCTCIPAQLLRREELKHVLKALNKKGSTSRGGTANQSINQSTKKGSTSRGGTANYLLMPSAMCIGPCAWVHVYGFMAQRHVHGCMSMGSWHSGMCMGACLWVHGTAACAWVHVHAFLCTGTANHLLTPSALAARSPAVFWSIAHEFDGDLAVGVEVLQAEILSEA